MLPILGLLPLLSKVPAAVSGIASIFGWDEAEDVANKVDSLVKGVAAGTTPAPSPEQMVAIQTLANQHEEAMARIELEEKVAVLKANQEQLETVNQTMREEAKSNDPYCRRWRPTFGYVVAGAWGLQALGIFVAFMGTIWMDDPVKIEKLFTGIGMVISALSVQWGVALSVLGVQVSARSQDKQAAAGKDPKGAIANIAALFKR